LRLKQPHCAMSSRLNEGRMTRGLDPLGGAQTPHAFEGL
jgi:hypothetical protein